MFVVEIAASALKEAAHAPTPLYLRIRDKIKSLASEPRPHGCLKLSGAENRYRIRVSDWRILYSIDDARKIVTIHHILPRDQAYRVEE